MPRSLPGRNLQRRHLVVAHALEPLSEVREWAREAEKAAKNLKKGDRNALCVWVCPRSGANVTAYGKWDTFPALLEQIGTLYNEKKLSFGLAHEFEQLVARMRRWDELHDTVPKMAEAIVRKKQEGKAAAEFVAAHATTIQGLEDLYKALLVARPFARARKETG